MKKIIIGAIILVFLLFICGYFINTHGFKISQYQITSHEIPESFNGFTIVQFSDSLIDSDEDINNLSNVAKTINELSPDIVVFTGDLTKNNYTNNKEKILNILKSIKTNYYKYAVIGDNDKKALDTYIEIMEQSGFIILNNEYNYLFNKSINPIKIIGITDTNYPKELFDNDEGINPTFNLVITHYPDYIDSIANNNVDLVLAGHSLNGQIRLPFIGGILKKDGARNYVDNHYVINNTEIYITGGLGTERIHFRFLNRPEINVYRLKK